MCSPPERFYRFGSVSVRLVSPAFTETERLRQFSCAPCAPDFSVVIAPTEGISVPSGEPRRRGDIDLYASSGGIAAVGIARNGKPLWSARHTDQGVSALFDVSAGVLLTSYVVCRIMDLPALLLKKGALVLHSSFIEKSGLAILFAAPKRTGKSTQAALWRQYAGARIINGDRALLELRGGVPYACGLPYAGTSEFCEPGAYPLRAVVLLSQGDENSVAEATKAQAFRALLEGCAFYSGEPCAVDRFCAAAEPF